MEQGIYNLPDTVASDTLPQVSFTLQSGPDEDNLTPINLTGAIIRCQFRLNYDTPASFMLTTVNSGGITITNASQGQFHIDEIFSLPLTAGIWLYDIEIEFANETVKTYIKGQINVLPEVTR